MASMEVRAAWCAGGLNLTTQAFSAMLHECIGQNKLSASRVPRITEKASESLAVRPAVEVRC